MYRDIKCKKCRKSILNEGQTKDLFLNAHSSPVASPPEECASVQEQSNIFLNEELLPHWIILRIEAEKWSRGKLNCPYCDSKIGSFDFVSGLKCSCSSNFLPPVHVIKSKIDLIREST
ncbi:E3 ubiquitin-protein ligase RNF180-like [Anoplophora glabripennis]|uniref:E3 ubiquitin-protein ligase RNF180-like n=1 Tax=Anoplophora glabripennis TaxID=217634 RepID=UPI000874C273|nr:E3 ubiquitin-protein ligase RNF180-like [Anoplophora glabripennis]